MSQLRNCASIILVFVSFELIAESEPDPLCHNALMKVEVLLLQSLLKEPSANFEVFSVLLRA